MCGCNHTCGGQTQGSWLNDRDLFPELPVFARQGTVSNDRWPVYVSIPAFLWEEREEEENGGNNGCNCCCHCRRRCCRG